MQNCHLSLSPPPSPSFSLRKQETPSRKETGGEGSEWKARACSHYWPCAATKANSNLARLHCCTGSLGFADIRKHYCCENHPPQKKYKKAKILSSHGGTTPPSRFYTMPRIQCHGSRGRGRERQTGHKTEEEEEEENKREAEETRNVSSSFLTLPSLSSEPFRAEKALSRAFFDCVFDSRVGAGPSSLLLLLLLLFSNFLVAARSNSLCVSLRRSKMPFSFTLCPFPPAYFALARVKDTLRRNLREREKEAEIGIKRGGGGGDAASDPSRCCIGGVNAFFGFLSSPLQIAQCLFCQKETREKLLGQIGLQLLLCLNPSPKKEEKP